MIWNKKFKFSIVFMTLFVFCVGEAFLYADFANAFSRSSSRSSSSYRSRSSSSYRSRSSSSYKSKSSSKSFFYKTKASSTKTTATSAKSLWSDRNGGGRYKSSQSKKASRSSKSNKYASKKSSTPIAKNFSGNVKADKAKIAELKKKSAEVSFASYTKNKKKFKKAPKVSTTVKASAKKSAIYNKAKVYRGMSYDDLAYRRSSYYRSHHWTPPSYVYQSSSSFGMFDAMVFWMILDNLNDRNQLKMAFNHSNDPSYIEWRAEADELAKTNLDLKRKLDMLDQKLAGQSGPKDPNYLVPGMAAEVALSTALLADKQKELPEIRLSTGSARGMYNLLGKKIKASGEVKVILQPSAGSMENQNRLANNETDAIFTQADAILARSKMKGKKKLPPTEQLALYTEYVFIISGTKSDIKTVKDFDKGDILYVGPKGSGTEVTWSNFCDLDSGYKRVIPKNEDYLKALSLVEKEPNSAMMIVSGMNSDVIREAERRAAKGTLRLVEVNDWDFNDLKDDYGNRVYHFAVISNKKYPNLQKGWIFGNDVQTLAVDTVMLVRSDWAEKAGLQALTFGVLDALAELQTRLAL